jgi:hypothetical protein
LVCLLGAGTVRDFGMKKGSQMVARLGIIQHTKFAEILFKKTKADDFLHR